MKIVRLTLQIAIGLLLFVTGTHLHAQHYPAGSEGIKAGSLPMPGFTFEDDNSFYFSDHRPGFDGQSSSLQRFNYIQSPRLTWMSDWIILGANYGAEIRVPVAYKQLTYHVPTVPPSGGGPFPIYPPGTPTKSVTDSKFGLADIEVQPVLMAWHLKHFDLSSGYSFWCPTGDYNKNNELNYNLGDGYWTHSFMFGVTWYPDSKKTWAVSLLNHYDINTKQYSSLVIVPVSPSTPSGVASFDTTLGDIYTLEWAISKTIKNVDVGLTGYYQQQVTDTDGPKFNGPTWQGERIHVAGIGPEVGVTLPKWGLSASLRYAYEFSAMDHPQGNLITLTIKKTF